MSIPTTHSSSPKGKVKCFRCRESISAKDGNWTIDGSRQVFVCAKCEKVARAPSARKAPTG